MCDAVVITGGAGGLGSAIVRACEAAGRFSHVLDIDVTRGRALEKSMPASVKFHAVSVIDPQALAEIAGQLARDKIRVSAVISVAGGAPPEEFGGFCACPLSVLEESVRVNLLSHIYVAHTFLGLLLTYGEGASITFMSSINAVLDFGLPAYSSAKAGLGALTRCLASEFGAKGLRVNAVLPGTVITDRTKGEPMDFDKYQEGSVLGRFASADEVARLVRAVALDFTALTGQELILDCGQSIRGCYEHTAP